MTHSVKAMSRFGISDLGGTEQTSFKAYSTNHTLAEVLAAGYFNSSRKFAKAGDVLLALIDRDGTPSVAVLRFATVPDSGNVTVALESVVLGQSTIADVSLSAVTGVDGSGSNAASKADVDTRLTTIETAINAILANLEAAGINASA